VTEPAVFYHFKSKGALFSTILEKAKKNYLTCLADECLRLVQDSGMGSKVDTAV
jgi:AcrR family transcriptional regulator